MDIGTGIAIAGVWIFAGMSCLSKTVTGFGMSLSLFVALIATYFLR